MKKLLLVPFVIFCFSACSVEPVEDEIFAEKLNELNAVHEDYGCAGPDNSLTITYSEAAGIESWDEVRKFFLSLLAQGVYRGGTFDPSIWDLIDRFNDEEEGGVGEYTTWYSIDQEGCQDTVMLTVNVVPDDMEAPPCELNAGADASITITQSEAEAIESWDEVRKLYLRLLEQGVARNGVFDPSIWDLINAYQERGLGDYTTEYTITDGDCTDSVLLTVTVVADQQTPPGCEGVNAGPDNSITFSYSEAAAIESWDEVRKIYLNLLAPGVPRNGSFDPSIWELIRRFNNAETGGPGDYSTVYTISEGECTDSVILTITVIPDES